MSVLPILRIAVPSPLRRCFDYFPPLHNERALFPGVRVRVPFGTRTIVGVLVEVVEESSVAHPRMRRALEVLDDTPLVSSALLRVLNWAVAYYQHAPGEVLPSAFPTSLRRAHPPTARVRDARFHVTAAGMSVELKNLVRAPRQAALLERLRRYPLGAAAVDLDAGIKVWRPTLAVLIERGWVEAAAAAATMSATTFKTDAEPTLNSAQAEAVTQVLTVLGQFQTFLLDGVTGSGKTEVYLQLTQRVLVRRQQTLVLVPEIGLTPQLVERFRQRFNLPIALLHSGLTDRERAQAWRQAQQGEALIVVGTRSAVFTPLPKLGLILVDEEHDLSFKQQDGFRYSARDVAVIRAREERVPIVLGSATPSLECLYNVQQGRYRHLSLPARAGEATSPALRVIDVRRQPMRGPISRAMLDAMTHHLSAGHQVLLFLNRRGFAPTLLCHACGWIARCTRCDSHLTLHQNSRQLRCHHCGAERPLVETCPDCASTELRAVGAGTERVEEILAELFPGVGIARVDRDSTRRVGALETLFDGIHALRYRILIGTQMLAKGHHFPGVTLVGVLNTDQGLVSADFRAGERMAQLIVQVAGRAGRGERAGEVLIQTHFPGHPLLRVLLESGYAAFAQAALLERQEARLPPYSYLALMRAEAPQSEAPLRFLNAAKEAAGITRSVQLLGPVPAPMEKRAGRYRAQLLVQCNNRTTLHRFLDEWLPRVEALKVSRQVRWSLDVDPQELY
ncbi:MAG: primosomal protein N' [Gammaproteobacteria bacterium]|nr:primosomal protein N' [Gammaproteobacteria bacterium]